VNSRPVVHGVRCPAHGPTLWSLSLFGAVAGLYVYGVAGSNDCPASSARIVDAAACQRAATATGRTFDGSQAQAVPNFPRGCYWVRSQQSAAWFNPHAVGAGRADSQLLCDASTAAPTSPGFTYPPTGADSCCMLPPAFACGSAPTRGSRSRTHARRFCSAAHSIADDLAVRARLLEQQRMPSKLGTDTRRSGVSDGGNRRWEELRPD
jgi:hypothetical protein